MLSLIKMIPSKAEYSSMGEEDKNLLASGLNASLQSHDLPRVGSEYHPAEMMAIFLSKYGYMMDLVTEFDLEIDYNEALSL